jgi:hypothetical protein
VRVIQVALACPRIQLCGKRVTHHDHGGLPQTGRLDLIGDVGDGAAKD